MDEMGQLLSISIEGMKLIFEASKEALELMLKIIMALKASAMLTGKTAVKTAAKGTKLAAKTPGKAFYALKYRKNAGKTNKDNFYLKSGGAAICQEIDKETFKLFEKYAKKTGVIYYEMADFSKEPGGKVHIMFPQDSLENLKSAQAMAEAELAKRIRKSGEHKRGTDDAQQQEEKNVHEESVGKMAESLGYTDLSLDEMMQACMDRLETEEQKEMFKNFTDEFRGLANSADKEAGQLGNMQAEEASMGERRGERSNGTEEPSLKAHIEEIKDAVSSNNFQDMVNRTDMVYMEVDEKYLSADINEAHAQTLTLSMHDKEMGRDISIQIPRDSVVPDRLEPHSHKRLVVLGKDGVYMTKDGEKVSAKDIKGMFNDKKDGRYSYSDTFRKLFGQNDKDSHRRPDQQKKKASTQTKPQQQKQAMPSTARKRG